jgi:hypothetical protein
MDLFEKVKARTQELWGKEVVTEAESFARAICEAIEERNIEPAGDANKKAKGTDKE